VGESEGVSVFEFVFEGGLGGACSVRNRMAELVGQVRVTTRTSTRDGIIEHEGLASHRQSIEPMVVEFRHLVIGR
jgi:hypothetical protein